MAEDIVLMNGPGHPVIDFRYGVKLDPPDPKLLTQGLSNPPSLVIVVEPRAALQTHAAVDTLSDPWIKPLGTGNIRCYCRAVGGAADGVAVPPVLPRIGILKTRTQQTPMLRHTPKCFEERLLWVYPGAEAYARELVHKQPLYILLNLDVPRIAVGKPLYWHFDDALAEGTPGPLMPDPGPPDTVSMADAEALDCHIRNGTPGTFRIVVGSISIPDPSVLLRDTVMNLTADSEFADNAVSDFEELSVNRVTA